MTVSRLLGNLPSRSMYFCKEQFLSEELPCQLDNYQASYGGPSAHTSPTETAGEVVARAFHQALLPSWLLVSTADLASSWCCPAQNASWLLTVALKNQGQILQGRQSGPSSLLPQDIPALVPLIINAHLVFLLHSSQFLNPLSLGPQNCIHLNSFLPSMNSSSPSKTQLSVATPSKEFCPPVNHQCTLLIEHQDTDMCVCALSRLASTTWYP